MKELYRTISKLSPSQGDVAGNNAIIDIIIATILPPGDPPFPQIDIIGAVVIVWRARGKIIRSVLCSIVCNSCAQ